MQCHSCYLAPWVTNYMSALYSPHSFQLMLCEWVYTYWNHFESLLTTQENWVCENKNLELIELSTFQHSHVYCAILLTCCHGNHLVWVLCWTSCNTECTDQIWLVFSPGHTLHHTIDLSPWQPACNTHSYHIYIYVCIAHNVTKLCRSLDGVMYAAP